MPNLSRIKFCRPEILKTNVKTGFSVQNYILNLCSNAVNSQRLLCSQKTGVFVLKTLILAYNINYTSNNRNNIIDYQLSYDI